MSPIPKYRLHKASSQAIVTLAGRDYYLGRHGTKASKQRYDALIAEWLASNRSASFGVQQADVKLVEVLAAYLAHAKGYYGDHRASEYHDVKLAVRRIKQLYADRPAADFGPLQFKAIRQRMIDGDLSRVYINECMKRIVRIFRWAAGEGMVSPEIYRTLEAIGSLRQGRTEARETAPIVPVDDAAIEAVIPHLPPVVADMVRVHRLIGCRPSELCSIKPCMIDRTNPEVWEVRLIQHKNAHRGKCRVLYLGPKAQEIIRPYLLRPADSFLFSPEESENKRLAEVHARRKTPMNEGNKPLAKRTLRRGDCYTRCSYERAISRACKKAGIPKWSPNQLRHSVGTKVRSQFGIEHAASTLGHSQISTTEIYAQQDRTKAIEVAKAVG